MDLFLEDATFRLPCVSGYDMPETTLKQPVIGSACNESAERLTTEVVGDIGHLMQNSLCASRILARHAAGGVVPEV
jgi:hypothetical protein